MKKLESFDHNFIKTLLENLPHNIEKLSVAKDKNDKKSLELISLAKQKDVPILFNKDGKLLASFKPSQVKDINFLEKLIDQKKDSLILILDHVMDPQNVGSILRTALAANVDAVVVSKNRACHLTETVRKVSKGASEIIPFVIVNNIKYLLKNLKTINFNILGCDGSAKKNYYECDYKIPTAIIMGSEGEGIKSNLRKDIDEMIRIPMNEQIESLNVSNACSVILFEARKQRI
jgi:23S rRNA (guanosine2251-2'-O)-methyltransferase